VLAFGSEIIINLISNNRQPSPSMRTTSLRILICFSVCTFVILISHELKCQDVVSEFYTLHNTIGDDVARGIYHCNESIYVISQRLDGDISNSSLSKFSIDGSFVWKATLPDSITLNDVKCNNAEIWFVGQTPFFSDTGSAILGNITDTGQDFSLNFIKNYQSVDTFSNGRVTRLGTRFFNILIDDDKIQVHGTSRLRTSVQESTNLFEFDQMGNILSIKSYRFDSDSNNDPHLWREIRSNAQGGSIIFGQNNDRGTGNPALLIYTNSQDSVTNVLESTQINYFYDGIDLDDNSLLIAGQNFLGIVGLDGEIICNQSVTRLDRVIRLFGPFLQNGSEVYFASAVQSDEGTLTDVLLSFTINDNCIELIWAKSLDFPSIADDRFSGHFFINSLNEYFYTDSRVDSINSLFSSDLLLARFDSTSCYLNDYNTNLTERFLTIDLENFLSNNLEFPEINIISELNGGDFNSLTIDNCPVVEDCMTTFSWSEIFECHQVTFTSEISDFNEEPTYQWSLTYEGCNQCPLIFSEQPNPFLDFELLPRAEICLMVSDGNCSSQFCDIINLESDPIQIECSDIMVDTESDQCSADVLLNPRQSSRCEIDFEILYADAEGILESNTFQLRTTPLFAIRQDQFGLRDTCRFNVIVLDNTAPSCNISDQVLEVDTGQDSIAFDVAFDANDNCPDVNVTFSIPLGTNLPCGFNEELTMFVRDPFLNRDSCSFTLTVSECEQEPVCSTSFTYNEIFECHQVTFTSEISDFNEEPTYQWSLTYEGCNQCPLIFSEQPNPFLDFGLLNSAEICLTVSDGTCSSQFCDIINLESDPIQIECSDIMVDTEPDQCSADVLLNPRQSTRCEIDFEILYADAEGLLASNTFDFGRTPLFAIRQDQFGLRDSCFFNVEVVDSTAPSCSVSDQMLEVDTGQDSIAFDVTFDAEDNCSEVNLIFSIPLGTNLPCGYNEELTMFVEDASGNQNSCSFTLTVSECEQEPSCGVDFELEKIGCNSYSTFSAVIELFGDLTFTWTVNDILISRERNPILQFEGPGEYEVCLTATDSICSTVRCKPINNPEIAVQFLKCPSDIMIGFCGLIVVTEIPVAVDECTNTEYAVICQRSDDEELNSEFPAGITNVVCRALSGEDEVLGECSWDVTVSDPNPPDCSTSFIDYFLDDDGMASRSTLDINDSVSDACSVIDITEETFILDCTFVELGEISTGIEVRDLVGNVISCDLVFTVRDTISPVCNTQNIILDLLPEGNVVASPSDFIGESFDNCSLIVNDNNFEYSCEDIGVQEVQFDISDSSGNSTSCSIQVTITDDNSVCTIDECSTSFTWSQSESCYDLEFFSSNEGVSDLATYQWLVDRQIISESPNFNFTPDRLTGTEVCLQFTDGNCESQFCDTINLEPSLPPDFEGGCSDQSFISSSSTCDFRDYRPELRAFSTCSSELVIVNYTRSDEKPITSPWIPGTTSVTASAIDSYGLESTCSFDITIIDVEPPTCTQEDIIIEADIGEEGINVSFESPTDLCSVLSTKELSHPSGDFFPCGITEVSYNLNDAFGNTSNCTFNIEVLCDIEVGCCGNQTNIDQAIASSFSVSSAFTSDANCQAMISTLPNSECLFITKVSWGDATFSDGMFMPSVDLNHLYLNAGSFELCLTYGEFTIDLTEACFQKTVCEQINVTSSCNILKALNPESDIIISPNPTQDIASILLSNNSLVNRIIIYDSNLNHQTDIYKKPQQTLITVDLQELASGIFFVVLEREGLTPLVKKIVKI